MNVNFPLDISALSAIRHLLVTCMVMTMTSQARLSTDPTGVSNSIGDGGNDIINVIQGEVLNFRFSASTPSGSPAEISNFKLLVDDTPCEAASFVKLAAGAFIVHWTASVPLDYPNTKFLQRVAVRDTTSQETIILAWVDVAEWEGMVAGVRMGDFVNEGANYQHCSHYSGKYLEPEWLENSTADVWNKWYRGPKRMVLLDEGGEATGAIAQITDSARYPFFTFTGTSSVPRLIDVSDPLAYPDKGTWCQNFLSVEVSVEVPASATISPGELKLVPFPEIDPRDSLNMVVNEANYQDTSGKHGILETMTRYLDGGNGRSMHFLWFGKQNGRATARGKQIFLPLGATITPYRAGGFAVPGLPLNLPSFPPNPYEPSLLPIQSEQWHQVVLKAGPEAGVAPDGLELQLGSGDMGDGAPQPGISIQVSSPSGLAPLAIPADGKIPLAAGSDLYQRLISTKGLTIFIKRDPSVDQLHHLSLNLIPKANSRSTGPPIQCAALDLLPVEIVPDYNRDGKIDSADRGKITTEKPWRFWINDDDDSGETEGTDISQGAAANDTNGKNSHADGLRDLVDFFPLKLDIKTILQTLPPADYYYRLTHSGTTADPSLRVIQAPQLMPLASSDYLKSMDVAKSMQYEESRAVHAHGPLLEDDFLAAAENGEGLLLIEGVKPTTSPIILKIQKKSDGSTVAEIPFQIKISEIKDMFRYKFVMPGAANLSAGDVPGDPPNWPDADRNGKHFVFAHGYNVNDTQSKGWGGEAFKRLFWSGSNARFTAFGWYGYQGQTFGITPDYQVNLDNAFATAKSFKQFLDLLEGEKTVAGHSMGNVLVGSAMHDWGARPKNYFMLNAAAAKECYDPAEADEPAQDAAMENQIWRGYPKILRASEWHRLLPPAAWPGSDWRGKLTWRGRFANVIQNGGQTDVYNFFSSGEEVLNNPKLNTPETNNAITEAWLKANRVWAVQEKRKGHGVTGYIHTSNYGGWRFNLMTAYDAVIHDSSSGSILMKTTAQLPNPLNNAFLLHLASNPFFDRSAHPALYEPETGSNSSGSNYAYNHRNTIISEMIPCTSFAAGRNAITVLGDQNIDMDASMKTDPAQWPLSNEHDLIDARPRPWLHSDIREKAFTHNWNAYQKFVEIGNLETNN